MGFNNLVINYGSIYSDGTNAALWFEDKAKHLTGAGSTNARDLPYYKRTGVNPPTGLTPAQVDLRNQTYNYGYLGIINPDWLKKDSKGRIATDTSGNVVIDWDNVPTGNKRTVNGQNTLTDLAGNAINLKRNVFGSQSTTGASGIIVGNYGDIVGSLNFGEGNDVLEMFSGSKIFGDISAKGTNNHLGLRGTGTDAFSGNITGFQFLTKADTGTWEITGKIGSFTQVDVDEGKLVLTADNSDYTGTMLINANTDFSLKDATKTAIVEAHSSSLPQNIDNNTRIYNNGTLTFKQDKVVKDNIYSGVIKGQGNVIKEGAYNLILTGDSTYTGGTTIKAGDLQLGNSGTTGSVTGNIDIANAGSSLIFNRSNNLTSNNNISGPGKVVKEGAGELTLTGTNTYAGGTTINAGTLAVDNDNKLGAASGPLTFNGGTLKFLTGFGVINAGRNITLNSKGGTIDTNGISSTISQVMHGAGGLTKTGAGKLKLTGVNSYTGLTTLSGGDLELENKGSVAGNIKLTNTASTLYFNNTDDVTYGGVISGTGMVTKNGTNVLKLTGANTWTGNTLVNSGMLIVNGDQSKNDSGAVSKKMTTTVKSGATLGGHGTVGGDVVIESGATLSPGDYVNGASSAKDALNIDGNLTLKKNSTSHFQLGQSHVPGGDFNDLVDVKGDLTLAGTLDVSKPDDGTFGPGVYRLFNYGGTLYNADGEEYNLPGESGDKTLIFGTFPEGSKAEDHLLQTVLKGQVNLINTNGLNLQFWDGGDKNGHGDSGIDGNSIIEGGNGVWTSPVASVETNNWTAWNGKNNAIWKQEAFAVFAGEGGTVEVDSDGKSGVQVQPIYVSGMQFLSDGYHIISAEDGYNTLQAHYTTLVPNTDGGKPAEGVTPVETEEFWIRVGADDFDEDVNITATINVPIVQENKESPLTLVKMDGGRLILNGVNDFDGETHIRGGTLQISDEAALGDQRVVMSDATTLQAGTDFTLNHEVNLEDGTGTLDLNNHALTMEGKISGDGNLAVMSSPQESDSTLLKALADDYGPSVLNLTQANTYTGSTTITGNGDTVNQVTVNAYQTGALGGTTNSNVNVNEGATLNLLGSTSAEAHNIAVNASHLNFTDTASAGTAKVALTNSATASLNDNATAGSSTITVDNSSSLTLADNASGGTANITNSGKMFMKDKAQARQATVVNKEGGTVDVSTIDEETFIGSLSGAGNVLLGDDENKTLTLGYLAKADTISGIISGAGNLIKEGLGVLDLRGANTWTGTTQVNEGTLLVNGNQQAATGDMTVANNATLGGMGTHGGVVTVEDGGILSPGETPDSIGTLTLGGLVFKEGSRLDIQFSQPTPDYSADDTRLSHDATDVEYYAGYILGDAFNNDLVRVEGDLTLDGTLNIKQEQPLTIAGVYRVMNYSGDLTDNGMELGGNLDNLENYYIQTAVEQQVNLVYTNGLKLRFWDGEGTRNKFIDGGNGTWQNSLGNNNWTVDEKDSDGNYGVRNAAYSDNAFAIFMAQGGDVKVDNSLGQVGVSGMQFAADGYHLYGDSIALTATWPDYSSDNGIINIKDGEIEHTDATPAVNYTALVVGDGTDALYTATIDNVLTGDSGIVKMGNGTLVLNGDNEYTGKTRVHGGELVISGDNNLGHDASGVTDVILNSGTLKYNPDLAAQDIDTLASITVEGVGGTLDTSQHTVKVHKKVVGDGALTKKGEGAAVLLDNATYTGGTHIAQGVLQLGIGGTAGGLMGDVVIDKDAELVVNRSDTLTLDGKLSGEGDLSQVGSGTTQLNGSASYSGTTTVAAGTLLAGAENSFSYASAHAVAKGATLNTGGMNQTVAGLDNSGLVTLRGDKVGSALTVKGDYHGDSGTIQINATQKGSSGDGVADRLVINGGKVTGSTVLDVDVSGLGRHTRGNGIEVVTGLNGADTTAQSSKDAFRLTADYLQGGAMQYRLRAGDRNGAGENWYLVNNFSNEASLFSAINSQIRFADLAMLGNLHQRVGDDVAYSENGDNQRVWVRMISRMDKIGLNDATETSTTNYSLGLQAGVDLYADPNWKAGLYTSFVDNNSSVRGWGENGYGDTGNVKDNAFYVGGYATWFADNGFYVDNVLQYGFHNLRVIPKNAGSQSYNPDAHSLAASVEVGQPFRLGESAWQLEPQAQLIYQFNHVDGASMDGISRTDMKVKDGNAVTARIGARLVGDYDTDKGKFQPYGRVNLWQGFGGTDKVTFSNSGGNTTLSSSKQFSTTEVAAGVTWTVQKDFQVYGEVGSHFSNSSDKTNYRTPVEASIGVKFGF
ncbi:autotransporter outer membrane beta-barrel domain-containing protein [Pseudenterobacter timonensis]|uniref:Autotransporter outer membrane beta-barrel domain-containing protein n=2 Tax=Pseudenterobacter timonensis TaxID=1755099 RepID=A0AAE4IV47_9ENTR|nr:autotransporter outer membrane beta-barrel domain-containing protein [Pseudenterobacter timonensis]